MAMLTTNWTGAIIDAYTQSGKTFKTFELLCDKVKMGSSTLALAITQSNSVTATHQLLSRARAHTGLPFAVVDRASELLKGGATKEGSENWFLADFFNARNLRLIMDFLAATRGVWKEIIVIIDECDAGGLTGVWGRLQFVMDVERVAIGSSVHVVLITATVPNLSKSLLQLSETHAHDIQAGSIIARMAFEPCMEHHFVEPHTTYVGPSWFKDTPGVWTPIIYPSRTEMREAAGERKLTLEYVRESKNKCVMEYIGDMDVRAKELCLIVTTTRVDEHRAMAVDLLSRGFNVTVELNGSTPCANYKVRYALDGMGGGHGTGNNDAIDYGMWEIPHARLAALADRGELGSVVFERKEYKTGISCREDITIGMLLQAALFMDTDLEAGVRARTACDVNWWSLLALKQALGVSMPKKKRRPLALPSMPRVALIAGHLAGRGITIQDPRVGFSCTGFVFTCSPDKTQRGAPNSQRFGRACGLLGDLFSDPARRPLLLATPVIMRDALANEEALKEKADAVANGALVCVRELITEEEWTSVVLRVKKDMRGVGERGNGNCKGGEDLGACPIKKLKSTSVIPDDAIAITEYSMATWADFAHEYNLDGVSPGNAVALAAGLARAGMQAHISIAEISMRTVSDLANFWRNPTWCHKEWQVIVPGGATADRVVCIWRNVQKLKELAQPEHKGRIITGHLPCGAVQAWRVCGI